MELNFNDIKKYSNKEKHIDPSVNLDLSIRHCTENYNHLITLIKNWALLKEETDYSSLGFILKKINEYTTNNTIKDPFFINDISKVLVEYYCIKSSVDLEQQKAILLDESVGKNDVFKIIMEECSNKLKNVNKVKSINRNINRLKDKTDILENFSSKNIISKQDAEDLIFLSTKKIYESFGNVSDNLLYGVSIECLKFLSEAYIPHLISSAEVLYLVTEFFVENSQEVSPIFLENAIISSNVYDDSMKHEALDLAIESVTNLDIIKETKLSAKDRAALPNSYFGLPKERKYPLFDENHLLMAIRYFNKCEENNKPILAKNIIKRSKELNYDLKNEDILLYATKMVKEEMSFSSDMFIPTVLVSESIDKKKIDSSIKSMTKTFISGRDYTVNGVKKFLSKVYSKPLDDILDDVPAIFDVLRRVFLYGTAFAINPYIGILTAFLDHLIHQMVNAENSKKLEKNIDREIARLQKRAEDKSIPFEERDGYKKAIRTLEDNKYKVREYKLSLLGAKERDELYNESTLLSEDIDSNIATVIALEQFYCVDEAVKASRVIANKAKNTAVDAKDKVVKVDKNASKFIDGTLDKLKDSAVQAVRNDNRERVIKGKMLPSFSKLMKSVLLVVGVGSISPAIAAIGAIGAVALSKKVNARERKYILDSIDVELQIVEKKMQIAENNNDLKALEDLMRLKKKLQYEKKRITYRHATGTSID